MDDQNLMWVRTPVTLGMRTGLAETVWSIAVMDPGLVSEGFLIYPTNSLFFPLYILLWEFPSNQATQGGISLILPRFLCIIILLYSLMRYLKDQWFSLWCQTRISLSSRTKSSSVEHSLDMSSLVISAPTVYFYTYYNLVGIWDGLLFVVRRTSPTSRLLSCHKT